MGDHQQFLYFVVLWKSLRVVSPFTTLGQRLQKKWYMTQWSARQNKQFNPIRLFLTIFLVPKNLQNILVDFQKIVNWKYLFFVCQFTILKQKLQNKCSMPRQCTRKGEHFSHLIFISKIIHLLIDLQTISSIF